MESGIMLAPMLIMLVFGIIGLASTLLWIWMLVDCGTKEPDTGNDKLIWMLVIIFTGALGALIYLMARRPARIRQFGA